MISEKKFLKSLATLSESLIIFEKIYYFLPKWNEYQSISHPKPSKIPRPNSQENNNLTLNSSVNDTGTIPERSDLVKSKVSKISIIKVKVNEEDQKTEQKDLTFETSSSYLFTPKNYEDDEQIKATLTLMLARFCKITSPTQAEVTRFFNIITQTKGCTRQTAHRITLDCMQNYKDFDENKRNLPYLSKKIEGKISDAMIKAREDRAKGLKTQEAAEVKSMTESPTDSDVFSNVQDFVQGFEKEHKL